MDKGCSGFPEHFFISEDIRNRGEKDVRAKKRLVTGFNE